MQCPECNGPVKTELHDEEFQYGSDDNFVKLRCVIPFRICTQCGFSYTDSEAEDIREKTVEEYLKQRG